MTRLSPIRSVASIPATATSIRRDSTFVMKVAFHFHSDATLRIHGIFLYHKNSVSVLPTNDAKSMLLTRRLALT